MKTLYWVGSSKKDYMTMPEDAKDEFGHSLHLVQMGEMPSNAKPLKGFGGAGVLELRETYEGNAWRVVFTVIFDDAIYVLHCFKKKSKVGIATPKHEIDIIKKRLDEVKHERNKL